MIALDGPTEEVYLLVSGGIDDEVHEPALDLGPLIAHLSRQPVGVLFECLMGVFRRQSARPPLREAPSANC